MSTRPYPKDLTIRCLDGEVHCHRIDLMRGSEYFKKRFEFNKETEDVIEEPIPVEYMNLIVQFTDPTGNVKLLEVTIEMFQCLDYYGVPRFINHILRQIRYGDTDLIMSNLEYFKDCGAHLIDEVGQYLAKELLNCKRRLFLILDDGKTNTYNQQKLNECYTTISQHLIVAWKNKCAELVKVCMDLLCGPYINAEAIIKRRLTSPLLIRQSSIRASEQEQFRIINELVPLVFMENVPNDIQEALLERLTRTPAENEDPMYFTNMILSKVDTSIDMESKYDTQT
jgi:hypothetical protein